MIDGLMRRKKTKTVQAPPHPSLQSKKGGKKQLTQMLNNATKKLTFNPIRAKLRKRNATQRLRIYR